LTTGKPGELTQTKEMVTRIKSHAVVENSDLNILEKKSTIGGTALSMASDLPRKTRREGGGNC